ncbi:2-isopropylmalate synthase [Enterobacteriaceae endosymbiont of Neohaemonia nigricornis]|uniref:2-isopropylmalate synthase n=1 Tax=Enterobacteriaceae endosymbiont of Neohaemonia nigricornis TaxID=2675792 RepID=UPI001448E521|nr:2-isopropylmalate synthase [Enterobacteriaceae endosymbiont of Neohaemonia nigricornis]QJC30252.1 2-isopropylmalate synthase [Enterobacteriaceae endosymbiont of Neohaemonia nigricornis]
MKKQIIILDTTLRDGEQSLTCSLSTQTKIDIALALEDMGVDIIEVGFPVSSPKDFKTSQKISQIIKNSTICGLARCKEKDIDLVYEALKKSKNFRIHIFLATSPIHIITKLKTNLNNIIECITFMIKYARRYTNNIEFSCEDSTRTPINDLCLVIEAAIKAGATTINIPDTVGYTFPEEYNNIILSLKNKIYNIDKCIISVHTHNDLGMAVGNTISAINAGARQIEGTINGIGERAGNCALEEIIMALYTRRHSLNFYTNINYNKIAYTTKLVSKLCNIPLSIHKPIIGENAFAHSSGIHQDGIIKNRETYEIFNPNIIGLNYKKLNLTAKSGRAALKYHMELMGYKDNTYDINVLYNNFIKLAEKKGQIFNYELASLAFNNKIDNEITFYSLVNFNIKFHDNKITIVTIKLKCGDILHIATDQNQEYLYAIHKVIERITNYKFKIVKYKLVSKSSSTKSKNKVFIQINYKGNIFHGFSISNNIMKTSILAIIDSLNHIWKFEKINNNI